MVHDGQKMKRSYQDYIHALQEERSKIQVFQRELPLCLDLVNQAIENCKQQLQCEEEKTTCTTEEEEEEEEGGGGGPVLEEFIPLKRSCSSEEEEYEEERCTVTNKSNENMGKKKNVDWMRSVQLWNQTPDPPSKQKGVVIESKKGGGAFHPFHKEKTIPTSSTTTTVAAAVPCSGPVLIPASSSTGDNSNKSKEDKDGQRKARRCWSPELHRRFLQALQQLGGSHAATPKQIRELMKVDGLTNDEVKSHLQKYRLHTRRPSQSIHSTGSTQPTQFLVVGGIWVPPPEYSAAAGTRGEASTATGGAPKGIYVPVATQPQLALTSSSQQQQNDQQGSLCGSERRGSHSVGDDNTQSNSREAVSSSSDTTTASPAF